MKAGHENPINSTAARVLARGESYEYRAHVDSSDSELPLPTRQLTDEIRAHPGFRDLTGLTVGRLKVVGLSEKPKRWVCRCSCGRYVLRKTAALLTGTAAGSPCDQCYLLAVSKKRDLRRRTGKIRGTEDFLA